MHTHTSHILQDIFLNMKYLHLFFNKIFQLVHLYDIFQNYNISVSKWVQDKSEWLKEEYEIQIF